MQADNYIAHVALSELKLHASETFTSDISEIDAYCSQKNREATRQTALIISYTRGTSDSQKTLTPFTLQNGYQDFSQTPLVLNWLEANHATLQDIHTMATNVEPCTEPKLPDDAMQNQIIIEARLHSLLQKTETLPVLQEAKSEVALAEFFTQHHNQQAAYILTENAKYALARLSENAEYTSETTALSRQLEAVESQLHTDMPFKFRTF